MKGTFEVGSLACALFIAGCGGGGDGATVVTAAAVAPPEGTYSGTLTGGPNSFFELLALENSTYWTVYGNVAGSTFTVAGFQQGTATFRADNTFSSVDSKDFGFSPARAAAVSGTFSAGAHTIAGTSTVAPTTVTFNGGPIANSPYNYNVPAVNADINGAWTLLDNFGETLTLNISNVGVIGGTSNTGCNYAGTATPRASGKNVFDVSVTFGAAPCVLPGQTVNGIGLDYLITGTALRQLIVAVTDASRTNGLIAFGTR